MLLQALCIISYSSVNTNCNYGPERPKFAVTSVILTFHLGPWTLAWTSFLSMEKSTWIFHDDTMTGTQWKRCDRRTYGQTRPLKLLHGRSKINCAKGQVFPGAHLDLDSIRNPCLSYEIILYMTVGRHANAFWQYFISDMRTELFQPSFSDK